MSSSSVDSSLNASSSGSSAAESHEPTEVELAQEDARIVDEELRRYENEGIIGDDHPDIHDFDILRYWQVSCHFFVIDFALKLDICSFQ